MNPLRIKIFICNSLISNGVKILVLSCLLLLTLNTKIKAFNKTMTIKLPYPYISKEMGISKILKARFSCRDFSEKPLNLDQISTLLWAAAGKNSDTVTGATRTIPSAGAIYPLEIYIITGKNSVNDLEEGLYHYSIEKHSLEAVLNKDIRKEISAGCLGQVFIKEAPVSLIIAAKSERTMSRYGQRGIRYVYMEAGHACQNIYLMATNLGLGTVEVGAFDDDKIKGLLLLDKDTEPISIMPVGYAH